MPKFFARVLDSQTGSPRFVSITAASADDAYRTALSQHVSVTGIFDEAEWNAIISLSSDKPSLRQHAPDNGARPGDRIGDQGTATATAWRRHADLVGIYSLPIIALFALYQANWEPARLVDFRYRTHWIGIATGLPWAFALLVARPFTEQNYTPKARYLCSCFLVISFGIWLLFLADALRNELVPRTPIIGMICAALAACYFRFGRKD